MASRGGDVIVSEGKVMDEKVELLTVTTEESPTAQAPAVLPPPPPDGHEGSLAHKFQELSAQQRVTVLLLACFSLAFSWLASTIVRSLPKAFPTGPLGAGQLTAFVFSVGAIALYVAMRVGSFPCGPNVATQISASCEFSCLLIMMFIYDRTSLFARRDKEYNGDFFWFLVLGLFGSGLCTLTRAKAPADHGVPAVANGEPHATTFHVPHLSRDQTEEWKGWMQVLFLWYHYFNNTHIYNAIRLFIAAYVWLTGFGNFSYYYTKQDFSVARFCQMQWRLNFFVVGVCAILGNEYMLYYICPLHTLFTLLIYCSLGVRQEMNRTNYGVVVKFSIIAAICFILWDAPFSEGLFSLIWWPLKWLVRYDDPYRPTRDPMSEWFFRTYLDHYIWIVGMLFAYWHPNVDAFLKRLDGMRAMRQITVKLGIVAGTILVFMVYYATVFSLEKKKYNPVHPYTSFIPLICYCVLRNIFQRARMYHLHLFTFLGKTTLETYITQFHIWMATTGLNGSPKKLLKFLPGDYPLCDFGIATIVLVYVSYRLFHTSNTMRTILLPNKASSKVLLYNVALALAALASTYLVEAMWLVITDSMPREVSTPAPS